MQSVCGAVGADTYVGVCSSRGALVGAVQVARAATAGDGAEIRHRLDGVVVAIDHARVDTHAEIGRPEERLLGRHGVILGQAVHVEVVAPKTAE